MEIRSVDIKWMNKELQGHIYLIDRLRQFHLSTRPMFFHRDSWNQMNDMLIMLQQNAKENHEIFHSITRRTDHADGND